MQPFGSMTYSLEERVVFLPEGKNVWGYGKVTKVLDDNMYIVCFSSYTENEFVEEEVNLSVEEMMKPPLLKKNDEDLTKPLLYTLFNGSDDMQLERVFEAVNKALLERYLDILQAYDGEEYFEYNSCKNTANMMTLQILPFISMPTYIWKVPCLSCQQTMKDAQAKYSVLLVRFTRQWIFERIHFYRHGLLYDTLWYGKMACVLCSRFVCDNELVFSCSLQRHGLCFECYNAVICYFTSINALLHSLLNQWLNKDCINPIVTFVAGDIKLLKNVPNSLPWTETFAQESSSTREH
ncbi:hypothetical protein RFI_05640 [Reticulomyxa filosa]|uniref:Uncharacterized protein n=1 Tax=Reticulomyxa filosa TaxID=46433 RepID=X6P079_RETFI|nr:hypothetical protein RFI_05640 [Reticulomyxa filosa]|eukprot:ETO31479.1 hypothetical protein RFI_05640 [Reticulomyxa filosa]